MIKDLSSSSFSSFSNQQQQSAPQSMNNSAHLLQKQLKKKYNYTANNFGHKKVHDPHHHKPKKDNILFSQFDDIKYDVSYIKSKEQIQQLIKQDLLIVKLKDEIILLQKQNGQLNYHNIRLMRQLEVLKEENIKLQTRIVTELNCQQKFVEKQRNRQKERQRERQKQRQKEKQRNKQNQRYKEKQKQKQRQKLKVLSRQIDKVKQNMTKLRQQSQKDKQIIHHLSQQLRNFEQAKSEWQWKNKFMQIFNDMVGQITQGIDQDWPQKKKINIGWKVVKDLIHKALQSGIKPAKILKSSK